MATYTIDKIGYDSNTYILQDSGALQLTGGNVTGPVNFGDSVTIDEATIGDLIVNGAASFTNNIQVNTINGVNVEFATLMNYKGAKAATSNLPTSGNSQGDVWHVNADGSEWGWNGSAWEELGKAIDLSGYQTKLTNPVTGTGTNGYLTKWTSSSTIGNGPALGSDTTKFLRNDGNWAVPPDNNTNYYHTTGSWNGLTYTATKVGSPGDLAFTIPTGTTSTTVAAGNHTHSDYVPMSSTSVSVKSDEFRIRNNQSSATAQAGTSNPYVTSLLLGDGREVTFDEYGDGFLGIHANNGIFLHTGTPIAVYDSSKTYAVGDIVWYNRMYYRCTTAITTAEAWTSSHWTDISASGGTVKVAAHIYPALTETYSLGSSGLKWQNVYTKTLNGIDVPTSPAFTDKSVKQTATTTNSAYEILFSYTADNTTRTEGARKTSTLTYNPNTKALVTGGTVDGLTLTASSTGFKIAGGTTSKTLTVSETYTLGAACEKAVTDSTGASAIGTGSSLTTERDVYHGLPTINNSHAYTSSTTIYAPTAGGTSDYYLKGAGTTTAPTWQAPADSSSASAISTGTALATERDIYYGLPTINGAHDYTSSTNIYAPTTAGTQGQALISNGSGAPTWGTAGASIQIVRW